MNSNDEILQALKSLRSALAGVPGGIASLTREAGRQSIAGLRGASGLIASQARGVNGAKIPATPGQWPALNHFAAGLSDMTAQSARDLARSLKAALASIPAGFRASLAGVSSAWSAATAGLKSSFGSTMKGLGASFKSFADGARDALKGSIGVAISGIGAGLKAATASFQKSFPRTAGGLGNFWSALKGAGGYSVGVGGLIGDYLRRGGLGVGRGARRAWRGTGRAGRSAGAAAARLGSAFRKYGTQGLMGAGRQFKRAGAAVGRGVAGASRAALGGASMAATAGAFARGLGGPLGIITAALTEAAGSARGFAERINAGNREMAAYNMGISAAFQQLQRNEYYRDIRLAKAVEVTTVSLARSTDRMRESFAGFDALTSNVQNSLGSLFAGLATGIGDIVSPAAAKLDTGLKAFDPSATFWNSAGEGFIATLKQVGVEMITAAVNPFAVDIAAAQKRIQDAADKAAQASAAKATQPGVFGDVFARGLTEIARGGPIRGPRRMP